MSTPTTYDVRPETFQTDFVSQAIALDGPGAMVSATHPIESHHAADVASRTAVTARVALLRLLAEIGPVDAVEFQSEYHRVYIRRDWPRLGEDSPRKRLQDLANKYLLAERYTDGHVGKNGLPKGLYRITDAGWDALREARA